ncbi:MAG: ATP-binding protein [Spirochaetales bacterium]|nr:ATP-binding protein [Spirochaetales bacterium]
MKSRIIKRFLSEIAFSERFGRQMRFIAGPRQSGKTFLARSFLEGIGSGSLYYNWDRREVRSRYRKEPHFFASDALTTNTETPDWVCLDEIHKYGNWKNILKDFYDGYEPDFRFIVTGSARLESFRRSGDSLAGRYFLFHLNPLILPEISGAALESVLPEKDAVSFIRKNIKGKAADVKNLDNLMEYGPFPEPFLSGDSLFTRKWREGYMERIIKEDLRDLTQIHHLEKVLDLIYLLPGKVAAPLSINSLKEDLEINFNTVKNYLNYLNVCYILFELMPYSIKKTRLVKKEKKIYFYDYTNVEKEGPRFENLIALELRTRVDLWNDATTETYDLRYVRTRDGTETDFLILQNNVPWLLIESKLSDKGIERHHYRHADLLGGIPIVQLVKEPDVVKLTAENAFIISAGIFLS